MHKARFSSIVVIVPIVTMALGTRVPAQDYPNRPIRLVTSAVGSGNDFHARLVSQGISGPLGQPVVVDNRGGGVLSAELVARAPADGYTLLVYSNSVWIVTLLQKTSYNPMQDFAPISILASTPFVVVVHPSLPVKSVKELIALARAKPGQLNYISSSPGTASHLAGEMLKSMVGVNILGVPYASNSQALTDLLSGEMQLAFQGTATVTPHIKLGKLRALAVTSAEASALFPGLPTVAASVPGYDWKQLTVMFAPSKTPAAITNRLNQEVVRFLKIPGTKQRLLDQGVEAVGSSPEELGAAMKSEMTRMGKVIRDAGIKIE